VLQRLPAAPAADELLDRQEKVFGDSSWQQRGLQGCGQTQQVAYTCQLEYPAFTLLVSTSSQCSCCCGGAFVDSCCHAHACGCATTGCVNACERYVEWPLLADKHIFALLQSSDYIIPVQLFDKGLRAWQALQKGEAFSMHWDGAPWR
jgi:hypothetical protein